MEFYQIFKEEITLILLENGGRGTLLNLFYEASITLGPKPDKNSTRKIQKNIPYEHNCKNIQLNINKIQKYVKTIIYPNQVTFILGLQGCLSNKQSINVIHHINNLKKEKTHEHIY